MIINYLNTVLLIFMFIEYLAFNVNKINSAQLFNLEAMYNIHRYGLHLNVFPPLYYTDVDEQQNKESMSDMFLLQEITKTLIPQPYSIHRVVVLQSHNNDQWR